MIEETHSSHSNGGRIYKQTSAESFQNNDNRPSCSGNNSSKRTDYEGNGSIENNRLAALSRLDNSKDFIKLNRQLLTNNQSQTHIEGREEDFESNLGNNFEEEFEVASIYSCSLKHFDIESACNQSNYRGASSDILSVAGDLAPESRKLLLDYYIKQDIKEGDIECGCHYDHAEFRNINSLINLYDKRTKGTYDSNNNTLDNNSASEAYEVTRREIHQEHTGERDILTSVSYNRNHRQQYCDTCCDNEGQSSDLFIVDPAIQTVNSESRSSQGPCLIGVACDCSNLSLLRNEYDYDNGEYNYDKGDGEKLSTFTHTKEGVSSCTIKTSLAQYEQPVEPSSSSLNNQYSNLQALVEGGSRSSEQHSGPKSVDNLPAGASRTSPISSPISKRNCHCTNYGSSNSFSLHNPQVYLSSSHQSDCLPAFARQAANPTTIEYDLDEGGEEEEEDIELASELTNALTSFADSPIEPQVQNSTEQTKLRDNQDKNHINKSFNSANEVAENYHESNTRPNSLNSERQEQDQQQQQLDCSLTDNNSAISLSWSYEPSLKQYCQRDNNGDSDSSLLLDEYLKGSREDVDLNEFIAKCIARHQREASNNFEPFREKEEVGTRLDNINSNIGDPVKRQTSAEDPLTSTLIEHQQESTREIRSEELHNYSLEEDKHYDLSKSSKGSRRRGRKRRRRRTRKAERQGSRTEEAHRGEAKEDTTNSVSNNLERRNLQTETKTRVSKSSDTSQSSLSIVHGLNRDLISGLAPPIVCVSSEGNKVNHCNCHQNQSRLAPQAKSSERLTSQPISGGYDSRDDCCCSIENSMRALKDIVKVSVPSLASLQYLPNQLNVNQVRKDTNQQDPPKAIASAIHPNTIRQSRGRKRRTPPPLSPASVKNYTTMDTTKKSKLLFSGSLSKQQTGETHDKKPDVLQAAESRDDIHSESCLLHRICLCNCMSRNNNSASAKQSDEDETSKPSSERIGPGRESGELAKQTKANDSRPTSRAERTTPSEEVTINSSNKAADNKTKSRKQKRNSKKQRKSSSPPARSEISSVEARGKQSPDEDNSLNLSSSIRQDRAKLSESAEHKNKKSSSWRKSPNRDGGSSSSSSSKRRKNEAPAMQQSASTVSEQKVNPQDAGTPNALKEDKVSTGRQREKQSPTFLSLLSGKKSQSSPSPPPPVKPCELVAETNELRDDDTRRNKTLRARWLEQSGVSATSKTSCINTLGSADYIATSPTSHSSGVMSRDDIRGGDSTTNIVCGSGQSRSSLSSSSLSFLRARSTSFTSNNISARDPSINSGANYDGCESKRARSSCSNREITITEGQQLSGLNKSRLSPYIKFLSPATRLFTSNSNSSNDLSRNNSNLNDLAANKENSTGDIIAERKKNLQQNPKSFLSRSLNRLSARVNRNRRATETSNKKLAFQSSTCVSPSISVSDTSLAPAENSLLSDYSNSVELNQYEELNQINSRHKLGVERKSCRSSPSIVVDKVGYMGACSCDLKEDGGECRHHGEISSTSSSHSAANRLRYPQAAHSDMMSDLGGAAQLDSNSIGSFRASSLPASPRAARRIDHDNGYNGRTGNRYERGFRSPRLSQSPVPFHSPASQSTKIEDGLKVCSSEHFEKHIGNIKGNQVEAQKKLFKAWINHVSPNLVRHDLVEELRDGIKLIGLLAALTNDKQLLSQYEKLNRDKQSHVNRLAITPSSRLKHLSNVSISINYLRQKVGMRLINLNPMDIVSGKPNVILGLCWNLILNFQLEQNFSKYSQLESDGDSPVSMDSPSPSYNGTSRLSSSNHSNKSTNEDGAISTKIAHKPAVGIERLEEYTPKDISNAKNRLLDQINLRFGFRLTHLTSNLVNGDIILAIIKRLLPDLPPETFATSSDGKSWSKMNDEKKLDHCFELASKYLGVPRLFSAADLRQQSISDNTSKPILVYLSMLINAMPKCNSHANGKGDHIVTESAEVNKVKIEEKTDDNAINADIKSLLDSINVPDRYEVDKLQSTLKKIQQLGALIDGIQESIDPKLVMDYKRVKDESQQVEILINWINEADKLFEEPQKLSADLASTIETYEKFFHPSNIPKISASVSPTLERQRRECIALSRQRIHFMEQTLMNRKSFEKARRTLRDWLVTAESKLSNALRPTNQQKLQNQNESCLDPIDIHANCYDDLINYFELESIDDSESDNLLKSSQQNIYQPRQLSTSLASIDDTASISGSLLSLGSTASRLSTLMSPKKASYYKLFDDFELKCRLLAVTLEAEQRDALLLDAREFKYRLKHITEQRVPQVLSELRQNITRCEMSIEEEQDESGDPSISEEDEIIAENLESKVKEVLPREESIKNIKSSKQDKLKSKATFQNDKKASKKKSKAGKKNKATEVPTKPEADYYDSKLVKFWRKIVRASKVSFSLNIILLLCLAGVCVVPLINKDICCELSRPKIETSSIERPT